MNTKALIVSLVALLVGSATMALGATRITSLPYTINTSNEYYITQDLTSSGDGIIINASNVSIDLRGQTISGTNMTGTGVSLSSQLSSASNVEIKNGTITGFMSGISLEQVDSARVIDMRIVYNNKGEDNDPSADLGDNSMIKDSTFDHNASGPGVSSGIISGTTSSNSGGNGLTCYSNRGVMFIGNTVFNAANAGIGGCDGITVINNIVYGNGENGIYAGVGSTVKNNTVKGNNYNGIELDSYSVVANNTAYDNNKADDGYDDITPCATCVMDNNVGN